MSLPPAVYIPQGGTPFDHIPSPRIPAHETIEIPYLGEGTEYDGGPFITYPSRQGWTDRDVHNPKKSGKTAKEIGSFFQIWFYWGLLTDVLRKPIHESDLVRVNKNGKKVLTTRNLYEFVARWYNRDRGLSDKAKQKYAFRVDRNLSHFCSILEWWRIHGTTPLDEWTSVYLLILGEYITEAYRGVYMKKPNFESSDVFETLASMAPPSIDTNRWWSHISCSVVTKRMIADGWCPSEVELLMVTLPVHGILFISLLQPPVYEIASSKSESRFYASNDLNNDAFTKILSSSSSKDRHGNCSEFSCSAYQCNEEEYRTKHKSESCSCEHVLVNVSDIVKILEKGEIPLILFEKGTIQVISAARGMQYVAISHVWSDGLGNPNANSLPACQIQYIVRLIDHLDSQSNATPVFWIDTLCCPIEPRSARAEAIRLMSKTYQDADKVLVLDSYLQSQSIGDSRMIETLLKVHCSMWNRRLWTLQEKTFGLHGLYYQFKDVSFNFEKMLSPAVELGIAEDFDSFNATFWISNGLFVAVPTHDFADFLNYPHESSAKAILLLHRLFVFRVTTKASDEAICLGSLLKLDIRPILSAPEASRMEIFWTEVPNIPSSAIFWEGPRLKKKGLRWAPSTFLNRTKLHGYHTKDFIHTRLTPKGLLVQYPGFLLGCPKGNRISQEFVFVNSLKTAYMASYIDDVSLQSFTDGSSLDPWSLEIEWTSQSCLCLISELDLDQLGDGAPKVCQDAILVVAYDVVDTCIFARTVCPVHIYRLDSDVFDMRTLKDCLRKGLPDLDLTPKDRKRTLWSFNSETQSNQEVCSTMRSYSYGRYQRWCVD